MRTEESGRSRFGYYGDEPTEGGVHTVEEKGRAGGVRSTPGVPGPAARLLDISELVRHVGMRYTHRFALPPERQPDFVTTDPITGEITLTNAGGTLHLQGVASTALQTECSRCLSPMSVPVRAEIQENFDLVTTHNAYQQEEVQAVDEDPAAAVISGNVLDLGDLLRQNLILEAPWQPICRPDCPGVAPDVITITPEDDVHAPDHREPVPDTHQPFRNLAALWEAKHRSDASAE
ncbi:MAG: DUF177 domain-containing protein [Capsulimonadales bacterium]|nr:DUF177 domain-containing protein [Capsulimonadales bacterium]